MNLRNITYLILFLVVVSYSTSCSTQQKTETFRVVYAKGHIVNDTVYIQNEDLSSRLNTIISSATLRPSKFVVTIWLKQVMEDSIVRIGINGSAFKKIEGQYKAKENLEALIIKALQAD